MRAIRGRGRACWCAAVVLACGLASGVLAQPGGPAPAGPGDGTELGGPKVMPSVGLGTIVERDSSGRLVKLEVSPAEAALGKLTLSDAERDAAQGVIARRARAFDDLVRANTKEILAIYNASQSGRKAEAFRGLSALWDKASAVRTPGPLADQLAKVLTPENAKKLRGIVDEYFAAAVDEERPASKGEGGMGAMGADEGATARVMLKAIGVELANSYRRTVTQGGAEFDALIKELSLTGEQEGKLRTLVQEALLEGDPGVSPRERRRIFATIWRDLNAEQRQILTEKMRAQDEGPGMRKPKGK